jgi:hypothetical protein
LLKRSAPGSLIVLETQGKGVNLMFDSVLIKTKDKDTAVKLTNDLQARFEPALVQKDEQQWEVQFESDTDNDRPELLSILNDRLRAPGPSIDVLINGEPYLPR